MPGPMTSQRYGDTGGWANQAKISRAIGFSTDCTISYAQADGQVELLRFGHSDNVNCWNLSQLEP